MPVLVFVFIQSRRVLTPGGPQVRGVSAQRRQTRPTAVGPGCGRPRSEQRQCKHGHEHMPMPQDVNRQEHSVIKVAMIGAGSVVFSKNLTGDLLAYPAFRNARISYMDIDADRLHVGAALCGKVAAALGATPTIEATTDRRAALRDADFVINMVQVGGFDSTLVDFEIPRKYGLRFTIADTTGPGGLFRALRTFPMLQGLCRDMAELCPRAVLLNYSNPMSMNMQTVTRTSRVRAVGLCHSVQGTLDQIIRYIGEDPSQVAFTCA